MFFTLLSLLFQCHLTNSLPDGAGSCHSGSAITHGPHPISPNGQLSDKAINVFVGDTQLMPSVPHTLNVSNESSVLSVHATSSFRGFLIRGMSASGNDVPDALMPLNEAQLERSLSYCNDYIPQASGVTHRSSNGKTKVMALIKSDQVDVLIVEITIMVTPNEYYYSRFSVNVADTAPTTQPYPYVKPSAIPSVSPSNVMSNFPLGQTVTTSSPPTAMATSYPSEQPMETYPYVKPSAIPSGSPSNVPSTFSLEPTGKTSLPPTAIATLFFSDQPTETYPYVKSGVIPSGSPSNVPSNFSLEPTGKTSSPPTAMATSYPSDQPTETYPYVKPSAIPVNPTSKNPNLTNSAPSNFSPEPTIKRPTTMAADDPQVHTEVFPIFNSPTFPRETATLLPSSSSVRSPAFGVFSLSLLIIIMLIHTWFLRKSNECYEIRT